VITDTTQRGVKPATPAGEERKEKKLPRKTSRIGPEGKRRDRPIDIEGRLRPALFRGDLGDGKGG